MFGRDSVADIFSRGPRLRTTPETPISQAHFPYAEAWKEFEKLQEAVRGGGATVLIERAFELALFVGGAFGLHLSKQQVLTFLLAWVALRVVLEFTLRRNRRSRFLHWPCPRCHSEWPGTKTEKDSRCPVCGLRLHQLAP